mgnify:CR=1 FL=1
MRIIGGDARGRTIVAPAGAKTRPTQDYVRESLFNIIRWDVEDARVLDLFAGTGQLGIEALSRGAKKCTFVENNRQAYKVVEENVKHCKLEQGARIVMGDAYAFLSRRDSFDIAFLDPPYKQGIIDKCLPLLLPMMSDDGVVICETSRDAVSYTHLTLPTNSLV